VRRKDFSYELPEELIAQAPLSERSASRMLVLDGGSGALTDSAVRELPRFLEPGDLLVFNDTRVVAARLAGVKPSGGRVEILLERALAGPEALAQLSASKPIRAGLEVHTAGGTVRVLAREDELWRIALPAPALPFFERFGAVPLPPYIRRAPDPLDRERYQSLYARARVRGASRRGRAGAGETSHGISAGAGETSHGISAGAGETSHGISAGALDRGHAPVHHAGLSLSGERRAADQLPSARIDAAD